MRRLPFDGWDVCTAAGAVVITVAAWMVYRPAGLVVGGLFLVITGLIGAAHAAKRGAA